MGFFCESGPVDCRGLLFPACPGLACDGWAGLQVFIFSFRAFPGMHPDGGGVNVVQGEGRMCVGCSFLRGMPVTQTPHFTSLACGYMCGEKIYTYIKAWVVIERVSKCKWSRD